MGSIVSAMCDYVGWRISSPLLNHDQLRSLEVLYMSVLAGLSYYHVVVFALGTVHGPWYVSSLHGSRRH